MGSKHIKTFLIWAAVLNSPPLLIWIPVIRLPFFLGYLLWINVPVQRFGIAKLVGGHHYKIEGFGALPQTPLSWLLIVIFWLIVAIVLTAFTAMIAGMRDRRRKEMQ